MKKLLMILTVGLFICGYAFAEVPFDAFKKAVTPSVPNTFTFDTEESHMMQIKYKGHSADMDVLKFELHERQKDFSKMDTALGATPWEWNGHSAIFIDGAQSGMSVVAVKLKNDAGILYINHRVFGAAPMTLKQLKEILAKIDLPAIEG